MQISRICKVYFSPCGNVEKVISIMADHTAELSGVPVVGYDFTLPPARERQYDFTETDLVFFGVPVYAGRVPNKIMPYIQRGFCGNGAAAVPVAVFGNRAYGDALIELKNLLEANAFHTVAGGAVVSQHSFSDVIAAGRPDPSDQKEIEAFARQVWEKLYGLSAIGQIKPVAVPGTDPPEKYYVPLGMDGKPAEFLKALPKTDQGKCDRCGICAKNCPMGSIDQVHPEKVKGICIKCQSCIRRCPNQAKYFDDTAFLSHKQMLEKNYSGRVESVFFLSEGRDKGSQ